MRSRKLMLLVTVVVLALGALFAGLGVLRREPPPASPSTATSTARGPSGSADGPGGAGSAARRIPHEDEIIAYLQSQFGMTIRSTYTQVRLLERLVGQFRGTSEHWEDDVLELLRKAFPDQYAQLVANLHHWLDYERWYKENRERLQGLPDAEGQAELWAERERLFGKEQARELWAGESQNQAFEASVKALDTPSTSISDKLAQYKETIQDTYQERSDTVMETHRQEMMDRFLDLSSVQQQLGAMTPDQRSASLREIRKGMGLDDAALARWDTLDQQRDVRWDAGAQYMKERGALVGKFSGPELEEQLKPLRQKYFGTEAETIGQEEASGFFRFTIKRKWGQN